MQLLSLKYINATHINKVWKKQLEMLVKNTRH